MEGYAGEPQAVAVRRTWLQLLERMQPALPEGGETVEATETRGKLGCYNAGLDDSFMRCPGHRQKRII